MYLKLEDFTPELIDLISNFLAPKDFCNMKSLNRSIKKVLDSSQLNRTILEILPNQPTQIEIICSKINCNEHPISMFVLSHTLSNYLFFNLLLDKSLLFYNDVTVLWELFFIMMIVDIIWGATISKIKNNTFNDTFNWGSAIAMTWPLQLYFIQKNVKYSLLIPASFITVPLVIRKFNAYSIFSRDKINNFHDAIDNIFEKYSKASIDDEGINLTNC